MRAKVRRIEVVATLIAIIGVFFTVKQDLFLGGEELEGDILEILAGMTWAVFIMGSSRVLRISPVEMKRRPRCNI